MTASERILNDLKHSIREEVRTELENELRTKILSQLNGTGPMHAVAAKAVKEKTARRPSVRAGVKRSPEEIAKTAGAVLAFVSAHPGTNAEAIKGALGVELSTIELPIKKLLASKQISRKGQKRATRYYAKKGA